MHILTNLLKSDYRICWKYFTRSVNYHSNNSSLLHNYPQCKFVTTRLNHDSISPVNMHKQTENEYYHTFLARNKKYVRTIAFLDYVPELTSPRDVDSVLNETFDDKHGVTLLPYLYTALKHSQESASVYDDARFVKLCETLLAKITTMHEDHVLDMLKILTLWDGSKRNATFFEMCRSIDKMFLQRYKLWGYDRCLLIMDHFYRLQVMRYSETLWNCMKRLWRNPNRLTSTQVVHAMFLVNAHRNWHPAVHLYDLEQYLRQAAYELGAEECAILALAFFKTQHRIKNLDLLKLLYQKLSNRVSTIDSIPLASFLKLFRFCHSYHLREQMLQLYDLLNGIVDKHDYVCCTHMALLGTGTLLWNAPLYEKIAQRLIKEVTNIRIKDIERTIFAFETFNYKSKTGPDVYKVALEELVKRKNDVFEYPRPFYSAITYLSLKGYYNFDLVNFLLSEDVMKKAFRQKDLSKYNCDLSLLTISDSIKIDFPEYSGNLLNESLRTDLCSSQSWKISVETSRKLLSMYDKVLFQAKSLLQGIFGGSDFVHYTYVLPHLPRPDLVFRLNGDTPMKLPENVLSSNDMLAGIPSKTEDWYVVTYFGANTVIAGTTEPIGNTLAKLRQLKKIGYKVLCIEERNWLNKSKDEHINYLRQLLKDSQRANQPEVQQPIRVELR